MNSQEKYATLGIDIGSTTVKIAILDENHNILFSDYERHFANIQETLKNIIENDDLKKLTTYRIARTNPHFYKPDTFEDLKTKKNRD